MDDILRAFLYLNTYINSHLVSGISKMNEIKTCLYYDINSHLVSGISKIKFRVLGRDPLTSAFCNQKGIGIIGALAAGAVGLIIIGGLTQVGLGTFRSLQRAESFLAREKAIERIKLVLSDREACLNTLKSGDGDTDINTTERSVTRGIRDSSDEKVFGKHGDTDCGPDDDENCGVKTGATQLQDIRFKPGLAPVKTGEIILYFSDPSGYRHTPESLGVVDIVATGDDKGCALSGARFDIVHVASLPEGTSITAFEPDQLTQEKDVKFREAPLYTVFIVNTEIRRLITNEFSSNTSTIVYNQTFYLYKDKKVHDDKHDFEHIRSSNDPNGFNVAVFVGHADRTGATDPDTIYIRLYYHNTEDEGSALASITNILKITP